MKLKNNLLLLITIVVMSSCVLTQKQQTRFLAKHCVGSDSLVTNHEVIFKDTTIYQTVQGPIQYLENPCKELCDSLGNLKHFEIVKKKNGLVGTIKSVGNVIAFTCEADSLKAVIKTMQHEKSTYKATTKIVKEYCEKEHLTRWGAFWIRLGQILLGVLLLYIALKCFKGYLTSVMPFLGKIL